MNKRLFFQKPFPNVFYNVTIILVALNVIIFLIRYFAPNAHVFIVENFALVPNEFLAFRHPWSLITYLFIHGDELHIIFNMIALLLFGNVIEHKLGSLEFILYYFLTGILSGLLLTFVYPLITIRIDNYLINLGNATVVGASAAIYALLLAYATFFPQNKLLIFGIIPIKAYVLVIGLALFSIIAPIFGIMGNVAHLGHLGGFIFGFLYFPIRLRINPIKEIIYSRRYYQ